MTKHFLEDDLILVFVLTGYFVYCYLQILIFFYVYSYQANISEKFSWIKASNIDLIFFFSSYSIIFHLLFSVQNQFLYLSPLMAIADVLTQ